MAYNSCYLPNELFYWKRDKPGKSAEIDYVVQVDDMIVPVEVKAGKTGTLRSLKYFLNEKNIPFGVRISMQPLSYQDNILSIPLYMVAEIPRLVREVYNILPCGYI